MTCVRAALQQAGFSMPAPFTCPAHPQAYWSSPEPGGAQIGLQTSLQKGRVHEWYLFCSNNVQYGLTSPLVYLGTSALHKLPNCIYHGGITDRRSRVG